MTLNRLLAIASLSLCFCTAVAIAGPVSPDCSTDKAATHAAEKSTVGVSTNHCSPSNTVNDGAKNAAGVDQKGRIEQHAKNTRHAEREG
jgi:hypothetical protein